MTRNSVRPLLLSTFDDRGGAARTTLRLHKGLLDLGVPSRMLVQDRTSDAPEVYGPTTRMARAWAKTRPVIDASVLGLYKKRARMIFSPAWVPGRVGSRILRLDPDILHLHWIAAGYVSIEQVRRFRLPVVWTMHDKWPMTGGCHYSETCRGFTAACGNCPQLGSRSGRDLSRIDLKRKARAWADADITLVSPSTWLANEARASSLFGHRRIEVIPNGVATSVYQPIERSQARRILGIETDKPLAIFGAAHTMDRWKGAGLLRSALEHLRHEMGPNSIELLTFGFGRVQDERWPFAVRHLGRLSDDVALALAYSAADVAVVPSTQEAFGNVAIEAMACATPCVAFAVGGLVDIIVDRVTGYIARPFDVTDLSAGIQWVLDGRPQTLGAAARDRAVSDFDQALMAQRYLSLYEDVLSRS